MAKKIDKKRLSDPAYRSTIPTDKLPSKYRKSRLHNRKRRAERAAEAAAGDDPNSLTAPLTPNSLKHELDAAVKLQYGPTERAARTAITEGTQRQTDISGWYKQYLDAVQGSKAAANTAYTTAEGQVRQQAPTPTGNPLEDQAALSRNALTNSFADLLKTQGVNTTQNYQNNWAQGNLMEAGSHIQQGKANDKLKQALRDVLSEKGAYATKYLGDARKTERDWLATTETLRQAGVKIDQASIPTPGERKTAADLKFFKKHGYYPPTGPPKKPKKNKPGFTDGIENSVYAKMTPAERVQAHKTFTNAGRAPSSGSGKDKYGNTRKDRRRNNNDWQSALGSIRSGGGAFKTASDVTAIFPNIDLDIADAALYWGNHKGKIPKAKWKYLRSLGIKLSKNRIEGYVSKGTGGPHGNGRP